MKKRIFCGLLFLCIAVLFMACGEKTQEITNIPYPYSWTQNSDGSVQVTLQSVDDSAMIWTAECSQKLQAESTDSGYIVSPLEDADGGIVTFTLETEAGISDQLYQISLSLGVDKKGRLQVLDSWNSELESNNTAGEDTDYPYQWRYDTEEGLLIYVTTGDQSWQLSLEEDNGTAEDSSLESSTGGFTFTGPIYDDNGFSVTVSGTGSNGILTLWSLEGSFCITLELQSDASGVISVASHSEEARAQTKSSIPGLKELEAQFGVLQIPQGLSVTECNTSSWENDDITITIAQVLFFRNGEIWNYVMAKDITLDALIEQTLDDDVETHSSKANGKTVTVAVSTDGVDVFWQADNGNACALLGEGEETDVLKIAADWMEAQ